MSSSADLRDMLDLPAQDNSAPKPPPPKKFKPEKRLEGFQRELYSLMGENTPPINVDNHRSKSKIRPDWKSAKKITPWKWKASTHTGREDRMKLHHWVKCEGNDDEEEEQPYFFVQYQKKMEMPEISEADYEKAYKDDDWTFEETRYLFELCREYDMRWLVIHDRYAYNNSRTMEDLKARFYHVFCQHFKLRKERGETLTQADEDLWGQMKYPKENEIKRKEHIEKLRQRPPAEIAEEEALVMESRKLQASAERMLSERQELMRLLDTSQAPGSSISQYQTSQGLQQLTSNLLSDKTKRRRDHTPPPVPVNQVLPSNRPPQSGSQANGTPTPAAGPSSSSAAQSSSAGNTNANTPQQKQPEKKSGQQQGQAAVQALLNKKVSSREEAALGITYHEKLQQGVHFRSTRINTFKPAVQTKVNSTLSELGLPQRPVMSTAKVCAKFESLQNSINVLLEAKKAADKLETEIRVLKQK